MARIRNRRDVLRLFGVGATIGVSGVLAACGSLVRIASPDMTMQTAPSTTFVPDLDITLRAHARQIQILPGNTTTVWTYAGHVNAGDSAAVQAIPGSYLGPIIRARTGQHVRITFENQLPEADQSTIIHWHGMHTPAHNDGHAMSVIAPGEQVVYEFVVTDRAGTYWFHPHPHGKIGRQVMMGLAGLFLVSDDESDALALPRDAYDIPLIIQDRTFDADNQIVYGGNHMTQMMGFLGERILVNGQPDYVMALATRVYRLRLLNGSNSRIYKLAWANGMALTVIASDGGLLPAPVQRDFVMLAPGERVELWLDLRDMSIGSQMALLSESFTGAESADGMGMMSHDNAPPLGSTLPILRIDITKTEPETLMLPTQLLPITRWQLADAVNVNNPRTVALTLNGMQWQLNGRSYEMDVVAADEVVKLNTLEVWQIRNELNPGQMMDANGMAHPIHIHGGQFQVLERTVLPELKAEWDAVRAGYVDDGWKDTVLVMPGERVTLLLQFRDYTGMYVYHCHNLEHEDAGMMRNYRVDA